ncbi:MAG: hypothetical protein P4L48_15530 [Mycobacterium sp.]|nr:hypothetical protein [Mycobacterium sp.]
MDVVLGVAVTGPVARLALIGPGARGGDVIDQSVVDLDNHPIEKLTETVVGTNRLLADEHHRLVATRLCWPDDQQADQLRQALEDSGVHNVAVLSESQAVSALMRAAGRAGGVLVVEDGTATLSVVGPAAGDADAPPTVLASEPLAGGSGAEATAMLDTMMARLGDHPDAPGDLFLLGASSDLTAVADQLRDASTMRVEIPDDPTFALARGAALAAAPAAALAAGDATALAPAAGLTGDETAFAPAAEPPAGEPQLAYSMAGEGEPVAMDEYGPEFDEYGDLQDLDEAEGERAPLSRSSLLIGNAVIAFAVIGLASLAAAVVIAVRPAASQQPVVGHQNAAPGKFMPLLPTQQQAPVPPPPVDQPNAGFQGGTVPAPTGGGAVPQQAPPPVVNGTPAAPVGPETPGTPGFVPNPNMPIPIPIIIPFPGWRPPYPYQPPTTTYSPPTTTVSPPTTTYSPPTTTVSPPTTTVSPPTTTYSPPTTTYSPPTTTYSPPTTTYSPPTTTYSPPTTTYSPPPTQTQTQQTVPTQTQTQTQQTVPTQAHTQQPVTPQQPHGGGPGGGRHGFGF